MPHELLAEPAVPHLSAPFDAHDRYLRALARRLSDDEHLAEDLTQDTWLAALRHSAASGTLQRAWLGTVARNFALQALRGRSRRLAREAIAARSIVEEHEEEPFDDGQRQRLLDAVARLQEPYQSAVRLRYFEDLPPSLIAERLRLPVETVRTRLKRGLAMLRGQLAAAKVPRP